MGVYNPSRSLERLSLTLENVFWTTSVLSRLVSQIRSHTFEVLGYLGAGYSFKSLFTTIRTIATTLNVYYVEKLFVEYNIA